MVFEPIEKNGFTVLELPDHNSETLLKVANLFGEIQCNHNTNDQGFSKVSDAADEKDEGVVSSTLHFNPHTDGAYLNGFIPESEGENSFRKICPPALVLLQCVRPAEQGGDTILVDGRRIIATFLQESPELLHKLLSRSVGYYHNNVLIADVPIFEKNGTVFCVRYSCDEETVYYEDMSKVITKFNILCNKADFQFRLEKNQILVIDNMRMLHGRVGFSGDRYLRRLWVADLPKRLICSKNENKTYRSKKQFSSPFLPFQSFSPRSALDEKKFLNLGIRLQEEQLAFLEDLIREEFVTFRSRYAFK